MDSPEPGSDEAQRGAPRELQRPGLGVLIAPTGALVPGACACCAAASASSRVERGADRRELIVPYCTDCLRHASARATRNLAAGLAACLLAATLAFVLPLAWPSAPMVASLALGVGLATLPILVRLFPRRPRAGHTAVERAAWWRGDGALACTNRRWGAELGRLNGSASQPCDASEPRATPWLATGPVLALVLVPLGWSVHHPRVRIVNLGEATITVELDGAPLAVVEPTSAESPAAGVEVRVAAGRHLLSARREGALVAPAASVTLVSGARHLYAPGSDGTCFWLEETRYGRHAAHPDVRLPLLSQDRFWVLPRAVDSWFSPNPPAVIERRSSGGVLVAVRQAPCAQAPAEVRGGSEH